MRGWTSAQRVVVASVAIGLCTVLAACRAGDAKARFAGAAAPYAAVVPLGEPPAAWEGMAVDVDNHAGSVWVFVEPWRSEPVVKARPRWKKWDGHEAWDDDNPPVDVSVSYEPGPEGRSALKVITAAKPGAPLETATDLVVLVPVCDGLRVLTADGQVILKGVGGAITVDNGRGERAGGRIELRTNRALREPVALVTTEGRVSAVLTSASAGEIDLHTYDGEADFTARKGSFEQVEPGRGRWRGVWNGGDNPVIVRTGRGDVRFVVTDNPEKYSTADGWAEVVGR